MALALHLHLLRLFKPVQLFVSLAHMNDVKNAIFTELALVKGQVFLCEWAAPDL